MTSRDRSKDRFSAVLANALDAVVAMDSKGNITDWNVQAEAIFGISRADAIGRRMSETIIPARFRDAHERGLKRFFETRKGVILDRRVELAALRADGTEFPIELTVSCVDASADVSFYAFVRDISERKNYEREREELLSHLQEALETRDRFIAIAGHELKTPITALLLNAQIAQRVLGSQLVSAIPAAITRFVVSTSRQLGRLSHLVENLLDISRISSGQLAIHPEEFDLIVAMRELLDQHAEQLSANGSGPHVTMDDSIIGTWDRYRVEQAVTNLVSNGLKYGRGNTIDLSVKREHDAAVIQVRDRGAGISDADLARLFQPFVRAEATKGVGGLGLGLYITHQIAEAHGGTLRAESVVGEGSTFTLTLPIRPGTETDG